MFACAYLYMDFCDVHLLSLCVCVSEPDLGGQPGRLPRAHSFLRGPAMFIIFSSFMVANIGAAENCSAHKVEHQNVANSECKKAPARIWAIARGTIARGTPPPTRIWTGAPRKLIAQPTTV